jgi:hypothetical protein
MRNLNLLSLMFILMLSSCGSEFLQKQTFGTDTKNENFVPIKEALSVGSYNYKKKIESDSSNLRRSQRVDFGKVKKS